MPISDERVGFGPGRYVTGAAAVPGVPTFSSNATGEITFTFSDSGNSGDVEFAILCEKDGVETGFLNQSTGAIDDVSEDWNSKATWGTYVTASLYDGSALTTASYYEFKAKAKNEAGVETGYSAWSLKMMPYRRLAYGPISTALSYTITSGNTIISGLAITGTSKTVTCTYTLTNKSSTASRIVPEFKRTDDADYSAATKGTGGDEITALTTSAAGVSHTFMWDTGTDLGTSYSDSLSFKITPYDASPTGGDADTAATTSVTINNLPAKITVLTELNGYTWDKDTTPEFIATMVDLILGDYAYFLIYVYDSDGDEIQSKNSAEVLGGWKYEKDYAGNPGSWTDMTVTGVAAQYLPPTLTGNRVSYTYQTAIAAGAVTVKVLQAEDYNVV